MLGGRSKTPTILEYLKKTASLKNALGAANYRNIELSLQSGKIHLMRNRLFTDSIDFEMVKYATDHFLKENEKAVICDHFAKLNKDFSIVSQRSPSMGNCMKTYYGDQYFVIAMLCGNGNHISQDFYGKKSISSLSTPPLNSLENVCLQSPTPVFYKDSDSRLVYKQVRMIDRVYLPGQNFSYSDSKGRMDGFIFIRDVSEVKF
jgi:erythromycin esterase-like protein